MHLDLSIPIDLEVKGYYYGHLGGQAGVRDGCGGGVGFGSSQG